MSTRRLDFMRLTRRQFLLAAAACVASGANAKSPSYREGTLKTGLCYKVLQQENARHTVMYMVYGSGARHDPTTAQGTAHVLEHLMFRATSDETGQPYDAQFKAIGVAGKAFTTEDITTYYCQAPTRLLPQVFALEAARMRSIAMTDAAFHTEKKVVLAEVASKNTSFQVNQQLTSTVMQGTSYAQSLAGVPEHIAALSFDTARQFHHAHYAPANCVLIIVGPGDSAEIEGWIYAAFDTLSKPFMAQPTHAQWRDTLAPPPVSTSLGLLSLSWQGPRASEKALRDYWSAWCAQGISPGISATDLCFEHTGRLILSAQRNSTSVATQVTELKNAVHTALNRTASPQWLEGVKNSLELDRRLQQHQTDRLAETLLAQWIAERTPPPERGATEREQLFSLLHNSPEVHLL
ncbi:MAG: insulinase family protein [Agitococcus sp.]|nr:insulinase family protein [Agitococcus sp.]